MLITKIIVFGLFIGWVVIIAFETRKSQAKLENARATSENEREVRKIKTKYFIKILISLLVFGLMTVLMIELSV